MGRNKTEGKRHMYTVADDVHEYIIKNGGGKFLNDIIRTIKAVRK